MFVPIHGDGIVSQFGGYDDLEEFDWDSYRQKYGDIHRLDRILEAEGDSTNRYKLSKQADVLMLFYLLSLDELKGLFERLGYKLDKDMVTRTIDYYMKRTSHGSTLSRLVHSWVLSRSNRDISWHLFRDALHSDVSDIRGGTTHEGIHLGAMAGTVDVVQRCYTGLETRGDMLRFDPCLPEELQWIGFSIWYRRHWITVHLNHEKLTVESRLHEVAPIKVAFRDQIRELKPGSSIEFKLT
jgi:alpha,alpha-trehalase